MTRIRIRWQMIVHAGVVLVAVVLAGNGTARAANDGGYAGSPVQWGVGARAVAMGGAYTALAEGATGFAWNPAGITQIRRNAVEAAWRTMSFDRRAGYLAFLHPFSREEAAMAFGWVYSGVGNLYEIDLNGTPGGQISDYTNAATFTFARRFTPALALGVNLRYVQHNIANINAYTVGFDLGAHIRLGIDRKAGEGNIPVSRVRLGVVIQRINQKYPWNTSKYWVHQNETGGSSFDERFPLIIRTGAAVNLWRERALISVDGEFSDKQAARLHVGGEGRPYPTLALRAGLDGRHLTFGAGFEPHLQKGLDLLLDYAFAAQPGRIDAEHIFSLGVRF